MILIIGGAGQGKTAQAQALFREKKVSGVIELDDLIRGWYSETVNRRRLLDDPSEEAVLAVYKDIAGRTEQLIEKNPDAAVILKEIGCGVVPLDPFDRIFRDMYGVIGTMLAKKADHVMRMIVGIPQMIR